MFVVVQVQGWNTKTLLYPYSGSMCAVTYYHASSLNIAF